MAEYMCHHCGDKVEKAYFPAKDYDFYEIEGKMYCLRCIKAIAMRLATECQTLYG